MATDYQKITETELPRTIAAGLIEADDSCHWYLRDAKITWLWQDPAPQRAGQLIVGASRRPGGLLGYFAGADFIILISRHPWKKLTDLQRAALIDHELTHCSVQREKGSEALATDDAGNFRWVMRPHDTEIFGTDLINGAQLPGLRATLEAAGAQLQLDFETAAADEPAA